MALNKFLPLFTKASVFRNVVRLCSAEAPKSKGIKPTKSEKFFLVYYKKYKSQDEIPEYIGFDVHTKLRNRIRISLANYLMLLTLVASLGMMFTGKRAAGRGESVQQMNIDWHKEMDDKFIESEMKKK